MMVRSVNKNDFDRRFSKSFCRSQTTKTATDDHYPRCLRLPRIRAIDRIEINIVHLSLSQAFEVRNLRESWVFSPAVGQVSGTCLAPRARPQCQPEGAPQDL